MSLRTAHAAQAWPNFISMAGHLLGRVEALGRSAGGSLRNVPCDLVQEIHEIVTHAISRSDNVLSTPNLAEELERQRPGFWTQALVVHFWAARDLLELLQSHSSDEMILNFKKISSLTCLTPGLLLTSHALLRPSKFSDRLLNALMRADTFSCYSAILAQIRGFQHLSPTQFEWTLTTVTNLVTVVSDTSRCVNGESIDESKVAAFDPARYRVWVDLLADSHFLEHAAGALLRMQDAARTALEADNCDADTTREQLNHLRRHFGQIMYRVIEPFLSQPTNSLCPRPLAEPDHGANVAMRAMLPLLRTLLSGTCVQFWLGRELIQLRLAVSGGVGPTHGLQAASFLPPQLLASPAGLSDHPSCALGLLLMHMNVCTTVWQLTVSGPRAPARHPDLFGGLIPNPAAVVVLAPSLPYTAAQVYELAHEAVQCVAQRASELPRTAPSHRAFTEMNRMAHMLVRLISELRPRVTAQRVTSLWRTIVRILDVVPLVNRLLYADSEGLGDPTKALLQNICLLLQMNEPDEEARGPDQGQGGGDAPAGGGGGAGHGAERGPAVSVHGALIAGFLPSLESALRRDVRDTNASGAAVDILNLVLRGTGVWPSILASGSIREVASIVVTLRKITEAFATQGPLGFLPGISINMSAAFVRQWTSNLAAMLEQAVVMILPPRPLATAGAPNSAVSVPGGSSASRSGASRSSQSRSIAAANGSLLPLNKVLETSSRGRLRVDWLVHMGGRPTRGTVAAVNQELLAVFTLMQWLPAALRGMHSSRLWDEAEIKLAVAKMVMVVAVQCLKARRRHDLSGGGGGVGSGSSKATGKSTTTTSGREDQAWTAAAAGTSTGNKTDVGSAANTAAAGESKAQSSAVEGQGAKDLHAFLSWRKFLTHDISVVPWLGWVLGVSSVKEGQDKEKDGALVCCALDVLEVLVVSMPEDVRDRVTLVAAAAPAAGGSSTGHGRAVKKDKKKDKASKASKAKDNDVGKGKTTVAESEGATAVAAAGGGGGGVAVLSEQLLLAHGRGTLLRALQALRPIPVVDLSSAGPSTPSNAPAFPASSFASSLSSICGSSTRTGGAGGTSPFAGGRLSVTPELEAHVGALWLEASARLVPDEVPDLPAPSEVLDQVAAFGVRPCGNTGCHNLEMPQDMRLKAKRCSRCKAVWYCCTECQKAHWRAGHKEACVSVEA